MNDYGLVCPLCGSWYSTSDETHELGIFWEEGEVCDNRAMTGPHPELCSNEHPCPGRLVPYVPTEEDRKEPGHDEEPERFWVD